MMPSSHSRGNEGRPAPSLDGRPGGTTGRRRSPPTRTSMPADALMKCSGVLAPRSSEPRRSERDSSGRDAPPRSHPQDIHGDNPSMIKTYRPKITVVDAGPRRRHDRACVWSRRAAATSSSWTSSTTCPSGKLLDLSQAGPRPSTTTPRSSATNADTRDREDTTSVIITETRRASRAICRAKISTKQERGIAAALATPSPPQEPDARISSWLPQPSSTHDASRTVRPRSSRARA